MPNQSSSPTKVNEGYSGISGSFSLCNARKSNQWGDVDNQGGRWKKKKNGAKIQKMSIFKIRPCYYILKVTYVFDIGKKLLFYLYIFYLRITTCSFGVELMNYQISLMKVLNNKVAGRKFRPGSIRSSVYKRCIHQHTFRHVSLSG